MDAPDYFQFFGLDPRFTLDAADLEDRFHRLSRRLHPDRHARATPAERERSLAATARLNDAYRTLRDPIARAEYLLRRLGLELAKDVPADIFELSPDAARDIERQTDTTLTALFAAYDQRPTEATLREIRAQLTRRKYIASVGRISRSAAEPLLGPGE